MPSTAENEFHMEEGQTFLLPTDAIYRISDKLDNASDQSSVYSNEPQVAVAENEDNDAINMGRDEFCRRLLRSLHLRICQFALFIQQRCYLFTFLQDISYNTV